MKKLAFAISGILLFVAVGCSSSEENLSSGCSKIVNELVEDFRGSFDSLQATLDSAEGKLGANTPGNTETAITPSFLTSPEAIRESCDPEEFNKAVSVYLVKVVDEAESIASDTDSNLPVAVARTLCLAGSMSVGETSLTQEAASACETTLS